MQTASDVDVIVTPTIPAVHDVVRRQILEAGENAYSEKPLVLTREEGTHQLVKPSVAPAM